MTIGAVAEMTVPGICTIIGIYFFRLLQWRKRIVDRVEALMKNGSEGEPDWVITRKHYGLLMMTMTEVAAGHSGVAPCMSIIILWRWKKGKPYFMLYLRSRCVVNAPLHHWEYFVSEALPKIKAEVAEFHAPRHAF